MSQPHQIVIKIITKQDFINWIIGNSQLPQRYNQSYANSPTANGKKQMNRIDISEKNLRDLSLAVNNEGNLYESDKTQKNSDTFLLLICYYPI